MTATTEELLDAQPPADTDAASAVMMPAGMAVFFAT